MSTVRTLAIGAVANLMLPCWGCGLTPLSHRKLEAPPATVRARTLSEGPGAVDPGSLNELVVRLDDEDPVVRMAAHEALRKRTGRDFGYVAWAGAEDRTAAVARWRSFVATATPTATAAPIRTAGLRPSATARRAARRRRSRPRPAPTPPPATTTTPEGAPS